MFGNRIAPKQPPRPFFRTLEITLCMVIVITTILFTGEGPAHAPCFKVRVTVDEHAFESPDFFKSRKAAEHVAVNVALMSVPFDGFQEVSSLTESCHMPASVQGGLLTSPPMTHADCSLPSISDSSVGRLTGTQSYLLYNRIRVYPCVPDISFPKGYYFAAN
ncbi:hypothetical protein Ddye_027158 [Dipteronia dyeriana]|uniref:Uncharacterized protein n=1 Tax=Dipteronia dyeriana TaxID=168575 RepID=A0AAD9WR42_9ROSI|nr:hypothetical protein Ddye_027158 [Dipteronia dyeriana]